MTTIRLLENVANDQAGAILHVSDDRARRLVRTGYAEEAEMPKPAPPPMRKKKE